MADKVREADDYLDELNRRSKNWYMGFDLEYLAEKFDAFADELDGVGTDDR